MGVSKYIATAIGLVLMAWTWDLAHSERDVALEQRREIEMSLEDMIGQYIRAKRPNVTDVIFQQLFSEDIASNEPGTKEMLVRFRYLINEPTATSAATAPGTAESGTPPKATAATSTEMTEQMFEGTVRLRSTDGLNWEWVDEKIRSPLIRYRNGTEIRSSETPSGGDSAK